MEHPSTPAAPLFALTCLYASHTSCFEMANDLSARPDLLTRLLPEQKSRLLVRTEVLDEPAPSLHPHYRGFSATTSRSASGRRDGTQRLRFPPYDALPLPTRAQRHGPGVSAPAFPRSVQEQQTGLA